MSQGHLTPLPLYVSPVFWSYDYSLRIYPVPDVIVFADKYDPFSITNTGCLCVNPVRKRGNKENGSKWSHDWIWNRSFPVLIWKFFCLFVLVHILSLLYFCRVHSQEVVSHLRCITHPTKLLRTGTFIKFYVLLLYSIDLNTYYTYTKLLCSCVSTANSKGSEESCRLTCRSVFSCFVHCLCMILYVKN